VRVRDDTETTVGLYRMNFVVEHACLFVRRSMARLPGASDLRYR
jgi:hypothetical protein